jgi:hypothetical protein
MGMLALDSTAQPQRVYGVDAKTSTSMASPLHKKPTERCRALPALISGKSEGRPGYAGSSGVSRRNRGCWL